MFDKFKTCKNCPDRTVSPNCHSSCKGYIARCEEAKKQKKHYDEARQYDIEKYYKGANKKHRKYSLKEKDL